MSDFERLGLTRRPTLFGCDPKENPAEFPLLLYLPNAPPADGSDPVTKQVVFLIFNNHVLIIHLVLIPSSFGTRPGTRPNSSNRHKLQRSMDS